MSPLLLAIQMAWSERGHHYSMDWITRLDYWTHENCIRMKNEQELNTVAIALQVAWFMQDQLKYAYKSYKCWNEQVWSRFCTVSVPGYMEQKDWGWSHVYQHLQWSCPWLIILLPWGKKFIVKKYSLTTTWTFQSKWCHNSAKFLRATSVVCKCHTLGLAIHFPKLPLNIGHYRSITILVSLEFTGH